MSNPPPQFREELEIVATDPLALERQRARYANRGITFLALLNGVAALILLASLTQLSTQVEDASKVVGAMLVFGSGALASLGTSFFAYVRRMARMQAPDRIPVKSGLWWLSLLGVIAGATCFLIGLNMAGRAVTPELETKATLSSEPSQTTVRQRKADKAYIRSLQQRLKDRNASEKSKKRQDRKSPSEEPATKDSAAPPATTAPSSPPPETTTTAPQEGGTAAPAAPETAAPPEAEPATPSAAESIVPETPVAPAEEDLSVGAEPQALTRDKCKNWNESANVCD